MKWMPEILESKPKTLPPVMGHLFADFAIGVCDDQRTAVPENRFLHKNRSNQLFVFSYLIQPMEISFISSTTIVMEEIKIEK